MKVAVYSTKPYDREFLDTANSGRHDLHDLEGRLTSAAADLAKRSAAVFVQPGTIVVVTSDSLVGTAVAALVTVIGPAPAR